MKKIISVVMTIVLLLTILPLSNLVDFDLPGNLTAEAAAQTTVKITTTGQVVDTFNGVQALYIPGTNNSNTGTYCCAAYVSKYYSTIYGVSVSNLLTGCTPQASKGSFSVTSSPAPGDIGYQTNSSGSGHWFIIKEANGDGSYSIIEQNWKWASGGATYCSVNRRVSSSLVNNFKVFRWSEKSSTPSDSSQTSPSGNIVYHNFDLTDISTKDATISCWIGNANGKNIWTTGFYIGTDPNNLTLCVVYEHIAWTDFHCVYKISNFYGELSPGTTYYYKFYTVEEENFNYSETTVKSFTTYGLSNISYDTLTTTGAATIGIWARNHNGYNISNCGFMIGTSPKSMSKNVIYQNIAWTDFHVIVEAGKYCVLQPNTTYYYRFYSVVDTTYYSNIYSFTTGSKIPSFTVTFNANNGSVSPTSKTVTYSSTYGSLPTPTRTGYIFNGWYTAASGGTKITADTKVTNPSDHTLYAQWTQIVLSSISVKTNPSDVSYCVGETLNTSGLTLTAKYSDGSTKTISSGFTCSPTTLNTVGTQKITVTYSGKTTSFNVIVNAHSQKTTTTNATCEVAGKTVVTCTVCGKKISETTIPAKGHTVVTDKAVAATCETAGKTEGSHCSVCNKVLKAQTTVPAKGHTTVIDKAVAATCETAGKTEGSHCTVCNKVIKAQTTVPAKGHTTVIDKAVAATCETAGKTEGSHCSVCNKVLVAQTTVPAKGHTTVIDKAVAATCETAGKTEGSHCSVCNKVLKAQTTTPAKGHTTVIDKAVAATCEASGKTEGSHCSVCNKVLVVQTIIPAKGHTTAIDKAVAATCETAGKTEGSHCSVCNKVLKAQTTVPAKGHTTVIDKAVAATCETAGKTEGSHCSVCGKVLVAQTTVPAKGHSYSSVVTPPTATEQGYTTYTCSICGDKYISDYVPAIGGESFNCKGTVVSSSSTDNSVKIEFIPEGAVKPAYTKSVNGTDVEFTLNDVISGNYIIRVSKEDHVTREYSVTVNSDTDVALKLHLVGDLNGDGKVNTMDVARANASAKGTSSHSGYEFACADINGDGKVNTMDVARMNAHAKGVSTLW